MISDQVKKIVKNYIETIDKTSLVKGRVINTAPFQIQIEELILTDFFLIIPRRFLIEKYQAKTIIDYPVIQGESLVNTKKEIVLEFNNTDFIKKGHEVLLIRQDGGQKFYVLENLTGGQDK